ncbi:MAG: adenosine deaminase [Gammaproteobacteria bacterium]|nr:MAG: adenosine deaminase [Gammaproteobacteria bacterium]
MEAEIIRVPVAGYPCIIGKVQKLKQLVEQLPKAELHIHIEGSLEPAMMLELARRNAVELPYPDIETINKAYDFNCLQDFLDLYYQGMSVLRTEQDFHDLTWAYLLRCKQQNVVHCEIFFDPQGHTERGIDFATFMDGFGSALTKAEAELGITSKLIMCFLRHLDEQSAFDTLETALPFLDKISAVGLDSSELGYPPNLFKNVFKRAAELGLKRVAHAGEEGPAEYVYEALDLLYVDRIDHGNRSLENRALVKRLVNDNMPLTVCPQSNLRLAVVTDMADHPIRKMLALGLNACINSDDPAYFGAYMNENFFALIEAVKLTRNEIFQLVTNSFAASFLTQAEKQNHLDRLNMIRNKA